MKLRALYYAMIAVTVWYLWNEVSYILANIGENLRRIYIGG